MLSVCHVSPTYFAPESVLGGGERYAEELARAMSARAQVKLVSFGPVEKREGRSRSFERVILRSWTRDKMAPFSPALFAELEDQAVVHCHQYRVLPTFLAAAFAARHGQRVFVSDLGGSGWGPSWWVEQARWVDGLLPISRYAAASAPALGLPSRVIGGGVDLERFPMRPRPEHDGSLVFLGRLLPHKGVHFLLEALPPGRALHVVGTVADPAYRTRLERLAAGKDVRFHTGLEDSAVVALLQRAMALVHPTPVDARGDAGNAELFGLVLAEAMACGCPVVASRAASLPEIVEHGVNGLLVPPNQPAAQREAIEYLAASPDRWQELSLAARRHAETELSWSRVVDRCLAAYAES
ncbi:MAG TPA: glycosyltransferase family 4 protein [Thermoanaerobaculia bacterium]|nr:glycosyltransferase family 4 protein [Thermoanaerobaculia bacterium]